MGELTALTVSNTTWVLSHHSVQKSKQEDPKMQFRYIRGGARNVIPLIMHVTHFYYYKNM